MQPDTINNIVDDSPDIVHGEVNVPFTPILPWPDPTPDQLNSLWFNKIWQVIKDWDINVPGAYQGYCGATGNHVVAILNAISPLDKNAPHVTGFNEIEQWK